MATCTCVYRRLYESLQCSFMLNMLSSRSMTNESQEYLLIEVKCNTCLLLSAKPSLTFATHSLALLFVLMGGRWKLQSTVRVHCGVCTQVYT